jgi:Fe-S oxidoreductase
VLGALRQEIRAGTPLVALEPSCLAVFRDELLQQLPHDEDARLLARQSYALGEYLDRHASGWRPPRLAGRRRALVQSHCHARAMAKLDEGQPGGGGRREKSGEGGGDSGDRTGGADPAESLLNGLGLDVEVLDAGCCGMAGAFGFERGERYEVSVRCAERALLPAVREAAADTLIIADGFSCREQIAQGAGRGALHLAQVLQLALQQGQE